jgi:hypothetical protein
MYVQLAHAEEQDAVVVFGETYRRYQAPAWLPNIRRSARAQRPS